MICIVDGFNRDTGVRMREGEKTLQNCQPGMQQLDGALTFYLTHGTAADVRNMNETSRRSLRHRSVTQHLCNIANLICAGDGFSRDTDIRMREGESS